MVHLRQLIHLQCIPVILRHILLRPKATIERVTPRRIQSGHLPKSGHYQVLPLVHFHALDTSTFQKELLEAHAIRNRIRRYPGIKSMAQRMDSH